MSSKGRYRLTLSYVGTPYVGWQLQANGVSVQEVLEAAFRRATGRTTRPVAASRTDAGVHAVGQVAHVDLAWAHSEKNLQEALNSLLPDDIFVSRIEKVPSTFHAQKDTRGKWYRYLIYQGTVPLLFEPHRAWELDRPLDLTAMRKGAKVLAGRHDFASFQGAGGSVKTTVRRLDKIEISVVERPGWPFFDFSPSPLMGEGWGGGYLVTTLPLAPSHQGRGRRKRGVTCPERGTCILFDFFGNGFLRHMVRNMVGSLIEVGLGKRSVADVKKILAARDRKKAGMIAPPDGLYLMKIIYDEP